MKIKGLPRPFFSNGNLPPLRDSDDRPLNPDGTINMKQWEEEIESGRWTKEQGLVIKPGVKSTRGKDPWANDWHRR